MSVEHSQGRRIAPLALAALGVVFGDIGTSPLYTMSRVLHRPGHRRRRPSILGVLSLVFWSLVSRDREVPLFVHEAPTTTAREACWR